MVFHESLGAVFAGAGASAGQFFAGLIKPAIQEITPIIRQETVQALKDTLPTLRTETVQFIQQGGQAAAEATKQQVQSFLPLAIIAGVTVIGVVALRK